MVFVLMSYHQRCVLIRKHLRLFLEKSGNEPEEQEHMKEARQSWAGRGCRSEKMCLEGIELADYVGCSKRFACNLLPSSYIRDNICLRRFNNVLFK